MDSCKVLGKQDRQTNRQREYTVTLTVKAVTKADIPKSSSPGRARKESNFDEHIEPAYQRWLAEGKNAWNAVPFDGTDEQFKELSTELTRATAHRGYGKQIRRGVDQETNEPTFWFLVRNKIGSGPRGARNAETETDNGDATATLHEAPKEVAQENEAARRKSRRRDSVNA